MPETSQEIRELANQEYKYGFVSDLDADQLPPGLSEDVVRAISAKKSGITTLPNNPTKKAAKTYRAITLSSILSSNKQKN